MNAMIFAAGLGTRLRPLTNDKPKALVEFKGQPMLWYAIKNVIEAGAVRVVINAHHFAEQIIEYVNSKQWGCEILISDESDCLLDTGGGLVKAQPLFIPGKPVLIQNADILIKTNIKDVIKWHEEHQCDATLLVKDRNSSRYLLFDQHDNLVGWRNTKTNELISVNDVPVHYESGFCGVHLVEPQLIEAMGFVRPFSIINAYLDLAGKFKVAGYRLRPDEKWFDVGTVDKLKEANMKY